MQYDDVHILNRSRSPLLPKAEKRLTNLKVMITIDSQYSRPFLTDQSVSCAFNSRLYSKRFMEASSLTPNFVLTLVNHPISITKNISMQLSKDLKVPKTIDFLANYNEIKSRMTPLSPTRRFQILRPLLNAFEHNHATDLMCHHHVAYSNVSNTIHLLHLHFTTLLQLI